MAPPLPKRRVTYNTRGDVVAQIVYDAQSGTYGYTVYGGKVGNAGDDASARDTMKAYIDDIKAMVDSIAF